jgi:putative oxidoreductase
MKKFCDYRNPDLAILIVRLVVALVFISHGASKFGNPGAGVFFSSLGLPDWLVPVIGTIEIGAGILVLLGITTSSAAYALVLVMLGVILFVKLGKSLSTMELELSLLSSALAIAWIGPGKYSLSKK